MSSLNKVMLIGRLGQDPEVRYTQSNTAVATISLATSERYKDKQGQQVESTEWHRIICWGRLAEICQEYIKKGSLVYFEGSIHTNEWTDKENVKKYTTEIKAHSMQMLDSKSDVKPPVNEPKPTATIEDDLDDDLPFVWLTPILLPLTYLMGVL